MCFLWRKKVNLCIWIPKMPGCTFLVLKGAVFPAHGRERLLLSRSWGQLLTSSHMWTASNEPLVVSGMSESCCLEMCRMHANCSLPWDAGVSACSWKVNAFISKAQLSCKAAYTKGQEVWPTQQEPVQCKCDTEVAQILAFRLGAELHRLKRLSQPFSPHCTHGSWPKTHVLNLFALVCCLCLASPWCAAVKKHSPSRSYHGEVKRNLQVVFGTDLAAAEPCNDPRMTCA